MFMEIKKTVSGDKLTLTLSGRLDTTSAPELQEVLIPELEGANHVELDFAGLEYVSSAGLRVLLMGSKKAKEKGVNLTLINVSDDVMEVFEVTGFSGILSIK